MEDDLASTMVFHPWRTGSAQWTANGSVTSPQRDFGTGVRLQTSARTPPRWCSDADSDVVDAFMPHSHPGGECYLVLEGEVWDETAPAPRAPSSGWGVRRPTATRGRTLILVLWPEGVKAA